MAPKTPGIKENVVVDLVQENWDKITLAFQRAMGQSYAVPVKDHMTDQKNWPRQFKRKNDITNGYTRMYGFRGNWYTSLGYMMMAYVAVTTDETDQRIMETVLFFEVAGGTHKSFIDVVHWADESLKQNKGFGIPAFPIFKFIKDGWEWFNFRITITPAIPAPVQTGPLGPGDFIFAVIDHSQEHEPGVPWLVYINPVNYWKSEGCLADQYTKEEANVIYPIADACGISEDAESMFSPWDEKMTMDEITQKLLAAGMKQDPAFTQFMER